KNITDRANSMLEKSKNPFVYTTTKPLSIERVFSILNRNFNCYFPHIDLIVRVNIINKKYILINEEGLELFLSDWLNNMAKYNKKFVSTEFFIEGETLFIEFKNDCNQSVEETKQMISDLTSNDRNEIVKRTT